MQKLSFTKENNNIKENKDVQYNSCKSTGQTMEGVQLIWLIWRLINMKSISNRPLCGCALLFKFGINLLI